MEAAVRRRARAVQDARKSSHRTIQSGFGGHRHLTYRRDVAHHQCRGPPGGAGRGARDSGYRAGGGCDRRGVRTRRPAVLHRRRHQRAAGRAGRLRMPAHLQRAAGNGAGHHRRRRGGAEPRHRDHRRRSGHRRPRSGGARLHGGATCWWASPPAAARPTCWARSPRPAGWARSLWASVARPIRNWRARWISPSRRWWVRR